MWWVPELRKAKTSRSRRRRAVLVTIDDWKRRCEVDKVVAEWNPLRFIGRKRERVVL